MLAPAKYPTWRALGQSGVTESGGQDCHHLDGLCSFALFVFSALKSIFKILVKYI